MLMLCRLVCVFALVYANWDGRPLGIGHIKMCQAHGWPFLRCQACGRFLLCHCNELCESSVEDDLSDFDLKDKPYASDIFWHVFQQLVAWNQPRAWQHPALSAGHPLVLGSSFLAIVHDCCDIPFCPSSAVEVSWRNCRIFKSNEWAQNLCKSLLDFVACGTG